MTSVPGRAAILRRVTSGTSETPPSAVTVALATYRRTAMLQDLLPHLLKQAGALGVRAEVVVVDNDSAGGARPVVETVRAATGTAGLHYVHEPRPGIAAARNAALSAALSDGSPYEVPPGPRERALVFLDDDETPASDWLQALVRCWRTTGADAVAGPVLSHLPPDADAWVRGSGAFARRRRPTGTALATAATNNLLLDLGTLQALGLSFDDRFGLTGGSDTMLTRQLVSRGGRIVWCDEAIVSEWVPSTRATRGWVLRRKRRSGNVTARVALEMAPGPRQRAKVRAGLSARAVSRMARGILLSLVSRLRSDVATRALYECDVASGAGLLTGLYGHRVTEYLRTD